MDYFRLYSVHGNKRSTQVQLVGQAFDRRTLEARRNILDISVDVFGYPNRLNFDAKYFMWYFQEELPLVV